MLVSERDINIDVCDASFTPTSIPATVSSIATPDPQIQNPPNVEVRQKAEHSDRDQFPAPSNPDVCQEQEDTECEDFDANDYEDVSDEEDDELISVASNESKQSHDVGISNVNSDASDLLLFLRSKCTVPQSAIAGIVDKCESLVRSQVLKVVDTVSAKLAAKNIDVSTVINVEETVANCTKVFTGIETKWKQDNFFQKKLNVVRPLRFFVGRHLKRKRERKTGARKNMFVENSVLYNPILSYIEKLVEHPDFEKVTDSSLFDPDENVLDSFSKGERFKKSAFFRKHPRALRLQLYFDEFDPCDAIASKAGLHKIGEFYLTFENIHSRYSSNLDFICLVALCNANTTKDVGFDVVMKPILKDLKKLEKGIRLRSGNVIHGSLISVIGDNLGIHGVCGFKEGFTAFRTCHHCMADPDQLHSLTTEKEDLLRTTADHDSQVNEMSAAKTKKKREELSTEFGINRGCSLNELETFHVIGSVVAETMHDLNEGCLNIQVCNLIAYLLSGENPVMTLDWLNEVLSDFDYEYSESSSKPSLIRKNHVEDKDSKLHQNSSQMCQLAMMLPLILGPHVAADDPHWENFLLLIQLCKIVYSPEVCRHEIEELSDIIEQYLTGFIDLYRELIPKQHFLTHYPRLILENGSLALYSCMRMEAFHRQFKRKAYSLGNYINIEVSLAMSYALDQAVLLSGSLIPVTKYGPSTKLKLKDRCYNHLLTGSEYVIESNWVTHEGLTVIPGRCFLAFECQDFLPTFALVKSVIVWPQLIFICQRANSLCFNPHMNAFEIQLTDTLIALKPEQLIGHSVFHSHEMVGKQWIVTKYNIKGSF
ncbi:hypothetical protein FOCC_FOCC013474 [Frankliniella occidentalis]|nr:hypothetical protein FOCC_FOCC013474 [Frankliniella occidentalis]